MDESNKKRKKVTKKATKSPTSKDKDQPFVPDIDVQRLLQEVLKEKYNQSMTQRDVASLTNALVNTLSEFLSCYILLSYNDEGKPVVITYSKNEQQSDALTSLLMRFFTTVTNKLSKPFNENPFE